jgi:hypothetical protein
MEGDLLLVYFLPSSRPYSSHNPIYDRVSRTFAEFHRLWINLYLFYMAKMFKIPNENYVTVSFSESYTIETFIKFTNTPYVF